MSKKKFTGSANGKGYYIALVLCAAAIGISGFLYYRNAEKAGGPVQADDTKPVYVFPDNQEVVATGPGAEDVNQPENTSPVVKPPLQTVFPVEGQTVAEYAMDCLSYNQTTRDWRVHNGIDIAAEAGTKVCAAAEGEVYTVYEDETMGMTVVIRHEGGYTTKYASLAETVPVKPGDKVSLGQTIGTVGNTALMESAIGDHVHFSVTCDSKLMDPADFLE